MASRKRSISRSVACSLAALLLLSGCMFIVSTFQSDSEEWVLVEDEVLADHGLYSKGTMIYSDPDSAEYTFDFDEETSTYTFDVTGGTKAYTTNYALFAYSVADDFDYSKNYKFVFNNANAYADICFFSSTDSATTYEGVFNLKSVSAGDDGYTASVILLDQYVTDLSFKDGFYLTIYESASSTSFEANTLTCQVYELQTDNSGSIAAGITGLIMIVCGVFAMPMHNILRRR